MDPDLVRLILLISGVALVVGIYLWDRYKRSAPRAPQARKTPPMREPAPEPVTEEPVAPWREEPTLDEIPEPPPARSALDPEPADVGDDWAVSSDTKEPQISMDLNFDAHGDDDYLHTDPALAEEVERLIIAIHLIPRKGDFSGLAIQKACESVHLVLGDMSIFHYHDGTTGKVLFSMASMLEPGTFPEGELDAFTSPGLTMFTQLPGARDGAEIYDEMIAAAQSLSGLLNAEIQDERRNRMTRQMMEHTRETIVEHRRKLTLARSRR